MANISELSPPPDVKTASRAMEIARLWIVDKKFQVALSGNLWDDPAAYGLMLVDLGRHLANAYELQGRDRSEVLARIREGFEAEWGDQPPGPSSSCHAPKRRFVPCYSGGAFE